MNDPYGKVQMLTEHVKRKTKEYREEEKKNAGPWESLKRGLARNCDIKISFPAMCAMGWGLPNIDSMMTHYIG